MWLEIVYENVLMEPPDFLVVTEPSELGNL
jgi:hypothetical protein